MDIMSSQTVTVYTKPACSECEMTKRWLNARDVAYELADTTEPGNLKAAKSLGYTSAPVVIVSQGGPATEQHWPASNPTSSTSTSPTPSEVPHDPLDQSRPRHARRSIRATRPGDPLRHHAHPGWAPRTALV